MATHSSTLATSCEELTHWKRPWCWERSRAGGEGEDRGWDGWMALPTQWTWAWVDSGSWWWIARPESGLLLSRSVMSDCLRPHGLLHTRSPCPSPTPGACSSSCDAIQPSHPPSSPLLLPSIPPSIRVFSNESALHTGGHRVLEFQLQHQSFQWTPRTDLL